MPDTITPLQVIRILNRAKVRFVLMGAYAIVGWTKKPRATEDVDILVAARGVRKAVRELQAAFPQLKAEDHEVVTRLRDPELDKVVIDVMKPYQDIFKAALTHTCEAELEGEKYLIPTVEMALALKFAPMVNLNRQIGDKYKDAWDFVSIVQANPDIDLDQLAELGDLVFSGGGKELFEKVGQARRGEKMTL